MNESNNQKTSPLIGKANVCSVEGCGRYSRAKGLCVAHHKRLQKYGDIRAEIPVRESKRVSNSRNTCTVEGCNRPYFAKGLCAPHRERVSKYGSARVDIPVKTKGTGHDRKSHSYSYWWTLRMNCSNPKHYGWKSYGALGLKVCEVWGTYAQFVTDMGERPSKHHILFLFEGDVFEVGKCRWELKSKLTNPVRFKISFEDAEKIRLLHSEGVPPKKLAADFGISPNNVYMIIKRLTWK